MFPLHSSGVVVEELCRYIQPELQLMYRLLMLLWESSFGS